MILGSLEKLTKSSFIVLNGSDDYLVRRALDEILEHLQIPKDDFDLQFLMGDEGSPEGWFAEAGTSPFLSPRRVVIVRNAQRGDLEKIQKPWADSLGEWSLLVLVIEEDAATESKSTKKKNAVEKICKSTGAPFIKLDLDSKKIRELVRAAVVASGRRITPSALELLIEMTGNEAGKALSELEKVYLFSSEDPIQERDIEAVVIASREWNIWNMIDSIVKGEISSSLNQLRNVLQSTKKPDEFAFAQLFPLISRQLRLLWQARVYLDHGTTPEAAPIQLAVKFLGKPNLKAESDYRKNAVMRSARSLTLHQLTEAFGVLANADARIKGLEAGFNTIDTIERLILELACTMQPRKS